MNKIFHVSYVLAILALGAFTFSGCGSTSTTASHSTTTTTAVSADSGTLVVHRMANLGNAAVLNVMVDGKRAATVTRGGTYTGPISAGPHVLSAYLSGADYNPGGPAKKVTVVKGLHAPGP